MQESLGRNDISKEKSAGPIPDVPCMDYLPTLGGKLIHSRKVVRKNSLHGAFGYGLLRKKHAKNYRIKGFTWIGHMDCYC